jgi:hypothetical protein
MSAPHRTPFVGNSKKTTLQLASFWSCLVQL